MIDFSLDEAQLYRMLANFFGPDRVVPKMRVIAVCGGELPNCSQDQQSWAKANECLFTVVDQSDNPKMVVEFMDRIEEPFDVNQLEHRQLLEPILQTAGITYVTISSEEFAEMTSPDGNLDLFSFFADRFGILLED